MTKKATLIQGPTMVRNCIYCIALVALAGSLFLCYYYFVRTTSGRAVDQLAFHQASVVSHQLVDGSTEWLDRLPEVSVFITSLIVVALLFRQHSRHLWYRFILIIVFMAAALVATRILKKHIFDRPDVGLEDWYDNSLPSGHVALASAAFATIFLMVSNKWRPFVGFAGATFVILTGISTVLSQWHRPSDVVAAFLIVSFWALACSWVFLSFPTYFTPQITKTSHYTSYDKSAFAHTRKSSTWGQWALWPILTMIGTAVGFVLVLFEIQRAPTNNSVADMTSASPDNTHYFWIGVWSIVCAGFFLASCAIVWFRIFDPKPAPPQPGVDSYGDSPLVYFPRHQSPLVRQKSSQAIQAPIISTTIYEPGLEPLFRISGEGPANIPIPHQDLSHRYEKISSSYSHPYLKIDDLYWNTQKQPQYLLDEGVPAQQIDSKAPAYRQTSDI